MANDTTLIFARPSLDRIFTRAGLQAITARTFGSDQTVRLRNDQIGVRLVGGFITLRIPPNTIWARA